MGSTGEEKACQEMMEAVFLEVGRCSEKLNELRQEVKEKGREQDQGLHHVLQEINSLQDQVQRQLEEKEHFTALLRYRDAELEQLRDENQKITFWMEEMEKATSVLLNSARWKMGNRLGELKQRLLFRPKDPLPSDLLLSIMQEYRQWKAGRD